MQNDKWLELGSHTTNVDNGQLSPLREDVADNGQLSPLREDIVDHVPRALPPRGIPLLEVFSVRIMNTHQHYRGCLYGEIIVTRGTCSQHIYNRNRDNAESISPGDIALLIGPTQSIIVLDSFYIDVALVYEYNNWILDDEDINGQLSWYHWNFIKRYNTILFEEVRGVFGWVEVSYVMLSNAVEATLEVTLINGDEENPAKLYGKLTARNSKFLDESAKSELFRKTLAENIVVRPGQLIPLSRSLVAVPLGSYLIVEVELWDSFNNNEIAKGIVEFPAQFSGTSKKAISSNFSEIKVKVTWTKV